ncbi:ZP domain-containing protein-like [Clytia hemisphaerica]|uniref:ZP domain-containing protein n=2 Tax=Clytia hemisphaerica TaxID=252671 RepID=A0A7M5X776_9CNID
MHSRNMTGLWLSMICISYLSMTVQAESNTTKKDFSIECDTEKMTIYILKDKISIPESDISQYNVSWNDPTCGPSEKSNETYLVLEAGYSSCGTKAVVEGDHVIFKNKVSINLNKTNAYQNDLLERIDTFATYSIECNVPQGVNVTHENGVNITKTADLVEGVSSSTDEFTVSMNLHKSSNFNESLTYPAVIDRLGRFNLELEIDTVANLYIIPRDCHGTSTSDRDGVNQEAIVTDGCPNADHVFKEESTADNGKKFRFSLNVFRFKNSNGMVYIHCSAHICLKNSNETKCQFGCGENNRRRRRSVEDNALTQLNDDLSKDYDIRTGLIIVTENSKNYNNSFQQDTQETSKNAQFFQTTSNIILIAIILVMLTFVCSLLVFIGLRRHRSGSKRYGVPGSPSKMELS